MRNNPYTLFFQHFSKKFIYFMQKTINRALQRSRRFCFTCSFNFWRFCSFHGFSLRSCWWISHICLWSISIFLANLLVEFPFYLGLLLIILLTRRIFSLLLAAFFRPLPGRSLLLPDSSNRLIASDTVITGISRKRAISRTPLPIWWANYSGPQICHF